MSRVLLLVVVLSACSSLVLAQTRPPLVQTSEKFFDWQSPSPSSNHLARVLKPTIGWETAARRSHQRKLTSGSPKFGKARQGRQMNMLIPPKWSEKAALVFNLMI